MYSTLTRNSFLFPKFSICYFYPCSIVKFPAFRIEILLYLLPGWLRGIIQGFPPTPPLIKCGHYIPWLSICFTSVFQCNPNKFIQAVVEQIWSGILVVWQDMVINPYLLNMEWSGVTVMFSCIITDGALQTQEWVHGPQTSSVRNRSTGWSLL